ncbi:serine/threonine protein kinase [Mycobacterium tuberculosis]|nr:serine/threonine protein kinase [Mycobacterium tuberculosis]
MAKASETERSGPGTQPADAQTATSATVRPLSTQAVFRPDFGDEDNFPHPTLGPDTEPQDRMATTSRVPRRSDGWAAAWWKSRGRPISIRLRP